jgi:hypothetical protein
MSLFDKVKALQKGDRVLVTSIAKLQSGHPKQYVGQFDDYEPRRGDFVFFVHVERGDTDLLGKPKMTRMQFINSTIRNIEKI